MKAKLYKGPFSGKTVTGHYGDLIKMRGEKKMTRRQREDYWFGANKRHLTYGMFPPVPMVEAVYKRSMRVVNTGPNQIQMVPCVHPDGSEFYEYVEGSKREF